ncbi:hypothetical protein ACFWWM_01260 [Streptomyces sp. NPDC058682]|uniref:hypothetical protein n=1 Tax=unclassified Streptomyces TaxID=2593676 RepID=UPI00225A7D36|nr:hypothetical protein [Streptomyces sp. NBC_01214]MCX4803190.1 cytochrome P450 [Streptomyces sp. NBC_01214]
MTVICEVLGVPLEDEPRFHHWIETALDAWEYGPETASEEFRSRLAGGNRALQEFGRFAVELYDRYARQPGPGMLSAMVHEDGPEGRMPKGLLTSNAVLLLFAGHETTVNLIAHGVLTLLRHPDELDLERRDNQHLGFSQGIHFCFGAPLARLEVQVAVGEFFRRVQNPRLVEDPPPYRRNQIFRGPRHVLVDIDGVRD